MLAKTSPSFGRYEPAIALQSVSGRRYGPDELLALSQRYRRLAESLFDPKIVAVVLDCARELDELVEGRDLRIILPD